MHRSPDFVAAAAKHPRPVPESYWVLTDRFLAGQYPGGLGVTNPEDTLRLFFDAGINTFVNLTEEHEGSNWGGLPAYDRFLDYMVWQNEPRYGDLRPARHYRFPIRDGGTTEVDQMRLTLDTIDEELRQDRRVYVHCLGGHGRTGTTVGCWLLRHGHASVDDVLELVQALHDVMPRSWPSPENQRQWDFVLAWPEGRPQQLKK